MNRNDLQALARLVIVAIALYIAASQAATMFVVPLLFFTDLKQASYQLIPSVVSIVALIAAVVLLIRRSDRIAQWLIRPTDAEPTATQTPDPAPWLPAAYRIACLLGGFVFLYHLLYAVLPTLIMVVNFWFGGLASEHLRAYYRGQWQNFITCPLIAAIGVYLLYGAPRFVRWHVKKTLELSHENRDNTPVM